jgi:hypothetical protein
MDPGSDESDPYHYTEPDTGSSPLRWWTPTQRIRTFAEIPIEAAILNTYAAPIYQQIAPMAFHLHQLGMRNSVIARTLAITEKTVARGIARHLRGQHPSDD